VLNSAAAAAATAGAVKALVDVLMLAGRVLRPTQQLQANLLLCETIPQSNTELVGLNKSALMTKAARQYFLTFGILYPICRS